MRRRQSTTLPGLLALVLLYAVLAAPADAEPLKIPLGVYITSATADLQSTYWFLQYKETREANPLASWLSDNPGSLVAHDIAVEVAGGLLLHHVWGKRHPRWERAILYGASAVRFYKAYGNYKFVQHLQQINWPHNGDRYIWPTP